MVAYKLHSQGDNWFHFRPARYMDSIARSFSVTFCHDGTVCMTGDMGCLIWRREYFGSNRTDYGFPNEETGIDYFAEKISRGDSEQKIKEWDCDRAENEINIAIVEWREGASKEQIKELINVRDRVGSFEPDDQGFYQMVDELLSISDLDSELLEDFGMDYSKSFKMKFELLKSVSDLILDAVNNKAVA